MENFPKDNIISIICVLKLSLLEVLDIKTQTRAIHALLLVKLPDKVQISSDCGEKAKSRFHKKAKLLRSRKRSGGNKCLRFNCLTIFLLFTSSFCKKLIQTVLNETLLYPTPFKIHQKVAYKCQFHLCHAKISLLRWKSMEFLQKDSRFVFLRWKTGKNCWKFRLILWKSISLLSM